MRTSHRTNHWRRAAIAAAGLTVLLAPASGARDLEEILKDKKIIDPQEANEAKAAKEKAAAPVLPPLPDWLNKVTFSGDVRIRNEVFFQEGTETRNRDRFRLRFGAKAKPNDESELGFRLASGNANDPISNNQSFTDTFTFKNINISNAYLKLTPSTTLGWDRPYVTLEGGKFDVPFYTTTSLMFDRDLTPEGFFEQFKAVDTTDGVLRGLALNLGQWIYAENSNDGEGVTYAFQGVANLALGHGVLGTIGVADYKWNKPSTIAVARNKNDQLTITNCTKFSDGEVICGRRIDPTKLGPNKDGKTASTVDPVTGETIPGKAITITGFTSQFNIVNAGGDFTIPTGYPAWPIKIFADYVINTDAKGPGKNDDTGYEAGAGIGSEKDLYDASLTYAYGYLETDAAISAFSDSDFGRDAGTNTKAHIIRATFNLMNNIQLVSTVWFDTPIDDVAGRNSNQDTRWEFDVVGKF
jgi:hypothetical protein